MTVRESLVRLWKKQLREAMEEEDLLTAFEKIQGVIDDMEAELFA